MTTIETNQIPAFIPADILSAFPEPFYSHNDDSLLMQITRAVMTVCDSVLQNSLASYQLSSFFAQGEASLNAFLSSLFSISFNTTTSEARLILSGLQKGFCMEGVTELAQGSMGCGVNVTLNGSELEIAPFLPVPARRRFLFMWLLDFIKWANCQVKLLPPVGSAQSWRSPQAIAAGSQLIDTTKEALDFSLLSSGGDI